MLYSQGIEVIQNYTQGSSVEPILDFIREVPHDEAGFSDALETVGGINRYPDSFIGILSLLSFFLGQRKKIEELYEETLVKYEILNALAMKHKPSTEELKIKKTITDFILKIEKAFEVQDLADESIVKELNRYISEANLHGVTENEIRLLRVNAKAIALLEPHLDKNRENFYTYKKLREILVRLVRIADFIIEDATKSAGLDGVMS